VPVCRAMQHAHQKGIIHRDVKPSNVLVTLYDGKPVPKVIDFGVAKAIEQKLTERTMFTLYGSIVGTLEYMAPEQAEMSGLGVDTRSDIYSLGVLLYELLTGTTPVEQTKVRELTYIQLLRMIQEDEPPKPSTRLSTTQQLATIAAQRRTGPRELARLVRGELDWIVMKALEKDRTRRYETASGLARDVERFLSDEPVEAGPPSARYRLRKYARKYRRGLLVAGAFAFLLVAGAAISAWEAVQARWAQQAAVQERDRAVAAEEAARREQERALAAEAGAIAARGAEAAQRQKAEAAQRTEADLRQQAQVALNRSENSLYLNRIALAERYWQANNQGRTDQILDACPANLRDWEWHYLKRLGHSEVLTLPGDQAAYSPDGKLLATDGKDNSVQIRDAQTGKISIRLRGDNPSAFSRLAFSPNSHRLAAICVDHTIRIWDLPSGRQTLKLQAETKSQIGGPVYYLVELAFSPDGKRLASAGGKSDQVHGGVIPDYVTVWDAVTGKELLKVADMGLSVAFSPDGKHLATANRGSWALTAFVLSGRWSGGMCILDAETGRALTRVPTVGWDDSVITYSPDGKWLVSARHEEIKIWDATTGKEIRTLRGHTLPVTDLSFSGDGKRLASASMDETVRIWDPARGETLFVYRGHVGGVGGVSFHPDGMFVASAGTDETVRIWDATAAQSPRQIPGTQSHSSSVALSPDGRSVACLQYRGSRLPLVLVDAATGREVRVLRSSAVKPGVQSCSLAFSPDSRLLASALDKEVQVWDVGTGQERASFAGVADSYRRGLAFSPDAGRLAFTAPKDSVEVWDIKDHKQLATYRGQNGAVMTIAFSPDGRRVASGGVARGYTQKGEARIWDAASGREIYNLQGHRYLVSSVTFSRDGKRLVTTSWDKTVRVWDAENGREVQVLRGHTSYVWSAAFNPSGTRLVTAGIDGTAKLWAWPAGDEVLSLPVEGVSALAAFVAGGNKLATANDPGVMVWDAAPRPSSATLSQ
jgi:WD40 repeat protein